MNQKVCMSNIQGSFVPIIQYFLGKKQVNIIDNVLIRGPTTLEEIVKDIIVDIVNSAVDRSEKNKEKYFTKKGTLRKRKKYDTSVEERKRAKEAEKISKHILRETCNNGCSRNCVQNIIKERQMKINSEYWKLPSENHQRQFIFSAAKNTIKKKSCVGENSRRHKTIKYYLKDDQGVDFQVCKKFFLGTLGYPLHNDRIVRDVLTKTSAHGLIATPTKKGHPSEKKIDRGSIRDHDGSFNPSISHYRREHAPERLYLPSDININLTFKKLFGKKSEQKYFIRIIQKRS